MKLESGQTIIELLVALTLIILFLSGVIIIQLSALKNVQYSRNKSEATSLAKQQIERLRVVRDSTGMESLQICSSNCYINAELTPVPILPTGKYVQTLRLDIADINECPPPLITVTPEPVIYKAVSRVNWAEGEDVSPAPEVALDSCITDWR